MFASEIVTGYREPVRAQGQQSPMDMLRSRLGINSNNPYGQENDRLSLDWSEAFGHNPDSPLMPDRIKRGMARRNQLRRAGAVDGGSFHEYLRSLGAA